jgi:hypoxanthine-DNA glycosylase
MFTFHAARYNGTMIEVHPFGNFVPSSVQYLLLGSFPSRPSDNYVWFYANGRNQFWPILEEVYKRTLDTKEKQQKLFQDLNMALADIILSCERRDNNNLDNNLINIVYNTKEIKRIIQENRLRKIFFSSRFVELTFKKLFERFIGKSSFVELIYLPSPSPRYATMNKAEKVKRYRKLLPTFESSLLSQSS